jgi:hypothetical protein
MFYDVPTVLPIVKARLNRLDNALDDYLTSRIQAAAAELEGNGIVISEEPDDIVLLADYTVWKYENRDKPGGMPEWLRLARRERWLRQKHDN